MGRLGGVYHLGGRTVLADIDKRRLHARQYALDAPQVDIANHAAVAAALDVQFLYYALLHQGNACFLRCNVDQDVVVHGTGYPNRASNSTVSASGSPTTPE